LCDAGDQDVNLASAQSDDVTTDLAVVEEHSITNPSDAKASGEYNRCVDHVDPRA